MLGIHKDHYYAYWLEPVAHNFTKEHMEIYYVGEDAALDDSYKSLRKQNFEQWHSIQTEDLNIIDAGDPENMIKEFRDGNGEFIHLQAPQSSDLTYDVHDEEGKENKFYGGVIKSIDNRGWDIKNAITWKQFEAGMM